MSADRLAPEATQERKLVLHLMGSDKPLSRSMAEELRPRVDQLHLHWEPSDRLDFSNAAPASTLVYLASDRASAHSQRGAPLQGEMPKPCPQDAVDVLQAAARAGFDHAIVVASAAIHAPHHHHPGLVEEDRVSARSRKHEVAGAWWDFEQTLRSGESTLPHLTVLRPAALLVPGGSDLFSVAFAPASPGRVRISAGYDPSLQLLSIRDLARAVTAAARLPSSATYHVAPRAVLPLRRALRIARRKALPLPFVPLPRSSTAERDTDPRAYLRYSWTVSDRRIQRDLGFVPQYDSAEAITSLRDAIEPTAVSSTPDALGLDPDYIEAYRRTLVRFLHDIWWRVETEGIEHVPTQGKAILTGIHRGFMPWDGVMALHQVSAPPRYPRFLIHPSLVKQPFLANFMTKLGGVIACHENADWVLDHGGGLLGLFPEGIRGAFRRYREATTVGRFGRYDFIKIALRHGAPIVPFVTVGSAEIFPILAKLRWGWWERFTEWPCFPIAPPFPLSPVPLPSKWHTRYLPPIDLARDYPPEAADDPSIVKRLGEGVRTLLQDALQALEAERRHIFFGSIFESPDTITPSPRGRT